MNDLLEHAVAAHGGVDRFKRWRSVSANQDSGGALWVWKRQQPRSTARVSADLHREFTSFAPFGHPDQIGVFTPERVAVETQGGQVVAERVNPRAVFAGQERDTPWDVLDRLYFSGYAMWTYLTVPFCLTWPGFRVAEIERWREHDETWRRLHVTFPPHIASHSTEQTFYFGPNGLLRRHDYQVEIVGGAPGAHYVSEYRDVAGIQVPTKRRVYARQSDNTPALDEVIISIDLTEVRFAE